MKHNTTVIDISWRDWKGKMKNKKTRPELNRTENKQKKSFLLNCWHVLILYNLLFTMCIHDIQIFGINIFHSFISWIFMRCDCAVWAFGGHCLDLMSMTLLIWKTLILLIKFNLKSTNPLKFKFSWKIQILF